ncbi:RNB domain-containing protein [Phanerochaete sordida]|uniref:DIS3-like exonuclease 2 n=1 Tax=Phanerochaete sordida TaxID=48140 RepID=A0A9P3G1Z9_9APHY|nr:RNB domain-containing protein [Phanerochaete sordida]
MTDEVTPQTQSAAPKREEKPGEKKPSPNGGQGAARGGPRRNMSRSGSTSGGPNSGPQRPTSGASNRRNPSNPSPTGGDDAKKSSNDGAGGKRPEGQRPKSQGSNNARGGNRRPSQGNRNNRDSVSRQNSGKQSSGSPANANPAEGTSDALSSLQRVIADLKTTTPSAQSANMSNPMNASAPVPIPASQSSSLPANAPVFQPGAIAFPGSAGNEPPRHRKAASLGAGSLPNNFNSYSPNLGAMMEDVEEGPGGGSFEEGEIHEAPAPNAGAHQRRSLSQSFTAPRFAALAAQQEDVGPSGRPQLAPGFMFGRRRPSAAMPMGPPINEEDMGFQFPQQQNAQQNFNMEAQQEQQNSHRRTESSGEISGIMAEQIAIQTQIEALQQQQQALYQQQLAQNQVLSFQTAGLAPPRGGAHRRVHSTLPVGMGISAAFAGPQSAMGQFGQLGGMGMGLDSQAGVPRGHGRRHSVNVLNKTTGQPSLGSMFPNNSDGFDDGFVPPAGLAGSQHARNDSTWRINGGVGGLQNAPYTADLAQAQAQLQSLQQFRAAAGGHHHKMPSFSFPNMLPNMMAANMMGLGLGGMNILQQQHQQFQSQLQQQSNQPQRKSLFAPYLPQASLPPLLAAGKLVVGILRVNKRNRSDAYVATEVLDADIYICGSKDRNRALEGDIVAVELLDVDEVWGTKKEKEEKKRKKEENSAYDLKGTAVRKNDKKKDDVEVEGQGLMLFEDEEVTDEVKPQFAGHVVAVVERMPGQLFSGTLGLLRPSSAATKEKQEAERREREGDKGDEPRRPIERPKIVWFKPTDKRVPLIAIPTEQAPPDFVQNSEVYANKLFVACIKRHPISSLHPFGTLVEELGPIGDIEVETSALLKDCNFPTEDFTDNVLKCLPPIPWTIPERELEVRKDLRGERLFTIDPNTAKDLDDALSIKVNEDGTYDVGVHIADVSYFVKPNTALDRDARKRATSVYLVQRAVPMLPPALSEQLCSLLPGQERLAFSVIFTMTKEAKVVKKWFGRTIVKSAAKLSYSDAQNVIDGKPLGEVPVIPEHNAADIAHDIKILDDLAKQLRERRFQNGAIGSESLDLKFELDDGGMPVDCVSYERTEAHSLIEEFMLATNVAVAQQVAVHFPEQALLRRHDNPLERRLNAFAERAERLGFKMDISSSGALMRSINAISDPAARRIMEILLRKATQRAKYFCAGMLDIAKYGHYALSVPVYTHFTSPIRRYADVLVHRQLDSILQVTTPGEAPKFTMDRDAVAKVAQQCNIKQDSARLAQEQSAHLFLCILIHDLTQRYGPVVRQAKVVGVLDAAFDVYVPEFGIEKRVHVDQMPIDNHVYDEHKHTLQIYWSERDVITWLAENSDDEHLKKVKQNAEQHALKMEVASRSVNDEQALFDEDDQDEIVLERPGEPETHETSKQRLLSKAKVQPVFEGLKVTPNGHKIQEIREMQTVPVIVTADLTKSPPVIKVYSVNPYAAEQK